jgi:outer membrane protein TolC
MTAPIPLALALTLAQAPAETPPPAAPQQPRQQQAAPQQATPRQVPPAQEQAAPPAGPVISFDEALRVAGEQNLDLRVLDARLRQADEISWKAWSGYLPQLTASGSYTRNEFGAEIQLPTGYYVRDLGTLQGPGANDPTQPESPSNPPGSPTTFTISPSGFQTATIQEQNQLAAQLELNQVLVSPQLWFLIKGARSTERAVGLTIENGRREILFGVARTYYAVASLRQAVGVSERLLEIAARQEKDARVRYQAGAIAKVGLLRAEIDRARAEQDLKRSRNSYLSAKIALGTLLNRGTDFEVADPPEPPLQTTAVDALVTQALRDRADVQAARVQVDAARNNRSAAASRYFPNLAGFGRYQISNTGGFTGESDQWAVGLGLQWRILDGGLRESDIREARARIAEAEAASAGAESRARQEVQQSILDLESARANAAKANEQRELALENQRLVEVAFRAGTATAVEVADATAALRNAEIAFVTESLNAQLAAVQVLRVTGAFHPGRR